MTTTEMNRAALECALRDAMMTASHNAVAGRAAALVSAIADYVAAESQGDDGLAFGYLDHVAQVAHMAGASLVMPA